MKLETTVVSFNVPTHVTVKTPGDRHLKAALSEFTDAQLKQLCDEFTAGVNKLAAEQRKPKGDKK